MIIKYKPVPKLYGVLNPQKITQEDIYFNPILLNWRLHFDKHESVIYNLSTLSVPSKAV